MILLFAMVIVFVGPLSGEAHGHGGWYYHGGGWWWAPWAVVGGAAVLAAPYYYSPYYPYYSPYYAPYYAPPPVVAAPPAYGQPGAAPPAPAAQDSRIFIYPRQGQNEQQQSKDQYECHSWARGQTGFDPTQPSASADPRRLAEYQHAMAACLDARGYTVR